MNILAVFNYKQSQVRTVTIDNEPWFVAQDVCSILEIINVSQALGRLDDDEKDIYSSDTLGGKQDLLYVSECGLYSLVLGSRKPEAKPFKRWITHDVIPSIRKTGKYEIQQAPVDPLDLMIAQIQQMKQIKADQELIKAQMALEAKRIDDLEYAQKQIDGELERIFKPDGDYYSIRGYSKLKGYTISLKEANSLGRLASQMSKEQGFKVDKLPDPRYGEVGCYSERVLEQLFSR